VHSHTRCGPYQGRLWKQETNKLEISLNIEVFGSFQPMRATICTNQGKIWYCTWHCRSTISYQKWEIKTKNVEEDIAVFGGFSPHTGGCHIVRAVLECTNCSLHMTVGAALSDTIVTDSISTVPRLSLLSRLSHRLRVGKQTRGGGRAVSGTWTHHAFMPNQMMRHLDDCRCFADVCGSFQKTAPRKTTENTVKHHDGGVGSMVANNRNGSGSSVVVTALITSIVS